MKAYSINPNNKSIKEIDIEMQTNTVYSYFTSILIDELNSIKEHTIYTDANAISNSETPYFIANRIVVGDALIVGSESLSESDVTIPKEELQALCDYSVSDFYKDALALLSTTDVNLYRFFNVTQNEQVVSLNNEWVLEVFNIADEKTKEYFLSELKKHTNSTKETEAFLQKMAGLAANAA